METTPDPLAANLAEALAPVVRGVVAEALAEQRQETA